MEAKTYWKIGLIILLFVIGDSLIGIGQFIALNEYGAEQLVDDFKTQYGEEIPAYLQAPALEYTGALGLVQSALQLVLVIPAIILFSLRRKIGFYLAILLLVVGLLANYARPILLTLEFGANTALMQNAVLIGAINAVTFFILLFIILKSKPVFEGEEE
ncbi:MAG: hypothetical protein JW772_02595 [Candidatus Diapherotrites archaeon]|nr:hypothetical protein [Candidatus Diapherotrites archaeon]